MTALNQERMLRDSERQIQLCRSEFHELLYEYRTFVSKIQTRRGNASNRTIMYHVKTISYFLRERKITSIDEITTDKITLHLKRYKRPKNIISVIRRFSLFLLEEKGVMAKSKFDSIMNIRVRNLFAPGTKKYSVPFERWIEILTIPEIKSDIARRFGVWLGLNFGLRLGEILHLTINDLKFDENNSYFYIRANSDLKYDDWEPKTISSTRRIFITQDQAKTFKTYLRIRENQNSPYLIYNRATKDKKIPVLENSFAKIFENCYIEFYEQERWVKRKLRFHVLRYSSAVFYYFKTKDIFHVSKLLGHSSIKQTEDYLGLTEQQIFDGVKNMMTKAWTK